MKDQTTYEVIIATAERLAIARSAAEAGSDGITVN